MPGSIFAFMITSYWEANLIRSRRLATAIIACLVYQWAIVLETVETRKKCNRLQWILALHQCLINRKVGGLLLILESSGLPFEMVFSRTLYSTLRIVCKRSWALWISFPFVFQLFKGSHLCLL